MWSSIANLKENLNKMALDVHDGDDDDELVATIYGAKDKDSDGHDRRLSHSYAHSKSSNSDSPMSNGFSPAYNLEIEQHKAEIKRLRESEAEIKALSVNYAALLKEKEEQIGRLNQEMGSLKKNLDASTAALSASRNEPYKGPSNSPNLLKVSGDQSPNRQHKTVNQGKSRSAGIQNGVASKQDAHSNGYAESKSSSYNEKEFTDLLEEKKRSITAMQSNHELEMKKVELELEKERNKSASLRLQLKEDQKMAHSLQEELNLLKVEHDKTFLEVNRLHKELKVKMSEIERLQLELDRREDEEVDDVGSLKRVISTLEKEKVKLKMEKEELEAAMKASTSSSNQEVLTGSSGPNTHQLGSFPEKDELEKSLQRLKGELKETRQERDKALQQLARLKQHLLEKESEESEKMDEDSKIIEELRQNTEYQQARIMNLETALQQAYASRDEVRMNNKSELEKSKEVIEDLKEKLAGCMRTIDAKNVELLNLQTALGQYYAEIEAKEHLEGDLSLAREEYAKLSQLLKDSEQAAKVSKRETEEISGKITEMERMVAEGKSRVTKVEEDNTKLRRALEQSMTRLNRMSIDSDFLVDRRIVIKLLITYFQRNYSKEVLDLMVRMLGFSEEDKQRIGGAQQGGKGMVRGVLGLPGRLVGGIIGGGNSVGAQANAASDQSFADLWVDFLLKESEERERREAMEASGGPKGDPQVTSATGPTSPAPNHGNNDIGRPPRLAITNTTPSDVSRSSFPYPSLRQYDERSNSEFSTVPLTPAGSSSWSTSLPPKY